MEATSHGQQAQFHGKKPAFSAPTLRYIPRKRQKKLQKAKRLHSSGVCCNILHPTKATCALALLELRRGQAF